MSHDDELLTSFQVGLILDKSARTVQRMAERGAIAVAQKLPGPNGAFLFRRGDVERLARDLKSSAAAGSSRRARRAS